MKRIVTAILLLASRCVFGASHFDDGIYLRAAGAPAPEIICQDGQRVFLGASENLHLLKVEFISCNNSNTLFDLRLVVPFDESIKSV